MKTSLVVVGGGAVGLLWYRFVGCRTGMCPIQANHYVSVLYGMLMGFLVARG